MTPTYMYFRNHCPMHNLIGDPTMIPVKEIFLNSSLCPDYIPSVSLGPLLCNAGMAFGILCTEFVSLWFTCNLFSVSLVFDLIWFIQLKGIQLLFISNTMFCDYCKDNQRHDTNVHSVIILPWHTCLDILPFLSKTWHFLIFGISEVWQYVWNVIFSRCIIVMIPIYYVA